MRTRSGAWPPWPAAAVLLLPALAAGAPVRATRPPVRGAAVPTGPDLFVGYSFLGSGEANLNGWAVSGSLPLRRSLRLVADLSGHYGSFAGGDLRQINFLGGVRVTGHQGRQRLRFFVEALVGGARSTSSFDVLTSSSTAWGGAPGAGVDFRVHTHLAVRGQAHLLLLHSSGTWDVDPRLSLGLAYRVGD